MCVSLSRKRGRREASQRSTTVVEDLRGENRIGEEEEDEEEDMSIMFFLGCCGSGERKGDQRARADSGIQESGNILY